MAKKKEKEQTGKTDTGGKMFSAIFEVFDVSSRRLRNGNKLRIVLEAPYNVREEKRLLDFKFREAMVTMSLLQGELPLEDPTPELGMNQETRDELGKAGL